MKFTNIFGPTVAEQTKSVKSQMFKEEVHWCLQFGIYIGENDDPQVANHWDQIDNKE